MQNDVGSWLGKITKGNQMNSRLFSIFVASLFVQSAAKAAVQDALITWTGNAGYHASINMLYDDSFGTVGAWGAPPPFYGTPTNQGILQISASFYTPSSLTPVFSVNDVTNSVITYKFLTVSFNTGTKTLFGSFDVGKDSFAEGEPGSSAGQYYLLGVSSPSLVDSFTGNPVDSGGQFTITIVPEPGSVSLIALAAGVLMIFRQRRAENRCQAGH